MGGRSSQLKGKSGEREIIAMLQPVVTQIYDAHDLDVPKLQRNTMQSADGGFDIAGLEWLALEVKRQEALHVNQWWEQTLEQAGRTKEPVLVYRQNNGKWKVCMYGLIGTATCYRKTRVTVDIDCFIHWFRIRLIQELES